MRISQIKLYTAIVLEYIELSCHMHVTANARNLLSDFLAFVGNFPPSAITLNPKEFEIITNQ